jgi:uncharacterized protein
MTLVIILCAAALGGILFHLCGIPGGMIVGAIAGVMLVKCLGELPPMAFPRPLQGVVYILLGAMVGNMFDPAMFAAVRETWPALLASTVLVLAAGVGAAVIAALWGKLDPTSAYLATSPGGLNVVMGLAADMSPAAPVILAYQMVRLYAIIFTVPLAAKMLHSLLH